MEKGEEPPQDTVTQDIPDIRAPPYPGPSLDPSVVINQPTTDGQPSPEPVDQQHPQPLDQQHPQPVDQQHPQPSPQPVGALPVPQQCLQAGQQPVIQYVPQQNQIVQPVNQVVVMQQNPTDVAGSMICPHCKISVVTSTEYKVGASTWMLFGLLCLVAWPCSWIPFCVNSCKDVQHSCPNCNNVLHIYRRR